jgi:hypothetical protein
VSLILSIMHPLLESGLAEIVGFDMIVRLVVVS